LGLNGILGSMVPFALCKGWKEAFGVGKRPVSGGFFGGEGRGAQVGVKLAEDKINTGHLILFIKWPVFMSLN
jgi:hypothetical protein